MADTFNNGKDLKKRGYNMIDPPVNILNYDPAGDGDDNDALVLVSREEWRRGELHDPDLAVEFVYRVMLAHRLPNGLEFPDKIASILNVNRWLNKMQGEGREHSHVIGVETNGVGWAAASHMRSKTNAPVLGYTTVGNVKERPYEGKQISMPRLAALDNLRVLLELHKIKMAKDCSGAAELTNEMNAFVWKRPGRPEAIVGQHDDLVMALCGAVWIGSKLIPPVSKQMKVGPRMGVRKSPSGAVRRIN
jgi:hypothetical protein